jgi:hydrogenase-1 operon protein HyaF
MSKSDLIPSVEIAETRPNPMIWESEEAAQGVFLGSNPTDDPLALLGTPPLQLPDPPRLPENFTPSETLLAWFERLQAALGAATEDPNQIHALSLTGLDATSIQAITEILGEGEVAGSVTLDAIRYDIRESVLAGVWRIRGSDDSDRVEISAAPSVILDAADSLRAADFPIPAPDGATMNAPAVLAEIRERAASWRGGENHVLNFTLFPMTDADHALLINTLGRADLEMTSGGFGDCRIMATRYRHVWAVQYVNAMGHTILDTVEIGALPPAARASWQDFEDSGERLAEVLEAYLP